MSRRDCRGNMLAMVSATALLVVAVLLFGLSYLAISRGNMEQRTAAEAAALVAAQDISRIVVDTEDCGFVGLTDLAPTGTTTIAGDYWFAEVRSINELMGTARLDYIIACELNDTFMKRCALQDRQKALDAQKELMTAINAAIQPGGSAKDVNNQTITPYADAERIWLKNNAKNSSYVPGTLRLTMGSIEGGVATQVELPKPNSKASVNPGDQVGGFYLSDKNIPYQGENFVFAASGKKAALADVTKFRATIAGLPFQMPGAIRAEADQTFTEQGKTYRQHFMACAIGGNDTVRPTPGALTFSFPDGPVPELLKPSDVYKAGSMSGPKCDVLQSHGGDFPIDSPDANVGAEGSCEPDWKPAPWTSTPPTAAECAKLGIYDWIRCGGTRVNIDSVLGMLAGQWDPPGNATVNWKAKDPVTNALITVGLVPEGIMHIYSFNMDGTITYRSKAIKPYPYTIMAHHQLYAECRQGEAISSSIPDWLLTGVQMNLPQAGGIFALKTVDIKGTNKFDFYMRDMVRQAGTTLGGMHDGEPMDYPALVSFAASDDSEIGGSGKKKKPAGGALNPPLTGKVTGLGGTGNGAPPIVSRQDDFGMTTWPSPPYAFYSTGPTNGDVRPTYKETGMCVDLRFRRQIDVGDLSVLLGGFEIGYVGEML
jgi:hypothetical protein